MADTPAVALLTIRAWCEAGSESPLRVEMLLTQDVGSGFQTRLTAARTETVVNAVRSWRTFSPSLPRDRRHAPVTADAPR